jgi:hypothetical protein
MFTAINHFLYITDMTATCILSNCKTEISIQNLIQWHTIHFMLFCTPGLYEVATCCQIKEITLTSPFDDNLFLLTLYQTNGITKVKKRRICTEDFGKSGARLHIWSKQTGSSD